MQYFTFILALFNPIYASILALIESTKKNTGLLPIISFSLVFATISFCIDPTESYDLYRHYQRIDGLVDVRFKDVFTLDNTNYLIFDTFGWLINEFGLPKQILTATSVFISYLCILLVFNDIKHNHLQDTNKIFRLISFVIMWLSIDFIFLSSGIRNLTANAIVFFYSYNLLLRKNLLRFIIGATIAFFIHPGSIAVTILTFISFKLSRYSVSGRYLSILGLVSIVLNNLVSIFISFIDSLLIKIPGYSSVYLDPEGIWGGGFIKSSSFNEFVANYLLYRLPSYVGMLYLIIIKPKKSSPLYFLTCLFVFALGLTFNFFTIYQRLSAFFLHLFALFIILEYIKKPSRFKFNYIIFYLVALILSSLAAIYANADYLITANEVLYKPLMFLLFKL